VGGFGAAYGGPAALQLLHDLRHPAQEKTATASLHGDTFLPTSEDEISVDTDPGDPGQSSAGSQAADQSHAAGVAVRTPDRGDGIEKPNRPRGGKPLHGQKNAQADAPPTTGDNGAGGAPTLFGAVGERSATDLARAFMQNFPSTSSVDPSWAQAQLGSAGDADVTISLDETGHIETVDINATGSLASSISRTMSLLRARPFTAKGKVTRLHLTAVISPATPDPEHLHGDVFAIHAPDGNGNGGFFALAIGRRVDVKITVR